MWSTAVTCRRLRCASAGTEVHQQTARRIIIGYAETKDGNASSSASGRTLRLAACPRLDRVSAVLRQWVSDEAADHMRLMSLAPALAGRSRRLPYSIRLSPRSPAETRTMRVSADGAPVSSNIQPTQPA